MSDSLAVDFSADRFHAVLEAAADGVVAVDRLGRIVYVNPKASEMFGYDVADLIGRELTALLPPGLDELHGRHLARFFASPLARPMGIGLELRAVRRDGTGFPIEIGLTPIPAPDDGTLVFAVVTDISARNSAERLARTRTRAFRALARLNLAIIRADDVAGLFDATCRIAVEDCGFRSASMAEGPDPRSTPIATATGDGNASFTPARRAYAHLDGAVTVFSVAITRREQRTATLTLRAGAETALDDDLVGLLDRVAANVAYGMEWLAAREQGRVEADHRAHLLDRLLTIEDVERAQIAEDIHDRSVVPLGELNAQLDDLAKMLATSAPDLVPVVELISATLATTVSGLQELLFELGPGQLDVGPLGLIEAAAAFIFEGTPVAWRLVGERDIVLSERTITQVVRIVKEALINVAKHADAGHVSIAFGRHAEGLEVVVTDDGSGLRPASRESSRGHRGMQTMADRASVLGGSVDFEGNDAGGTTVRLRVPLPPA